MHQSVGLHMRGLDLPRRKIDIRFLMHVSLWAIAMIIHQVASGLVSEWGHNVIHKMPPLPDLGHILMPNLQQWRWLPEVLIHGPLVFSGILAIARVDIHGIEHFLQAHGISMLIRALSFSMTLLPDASQMCDESKWSGSCHDLIFSGHMVALALSSMYLWSKTNKLALKAVVLLNVIAAAVLTIAVRNHYSVDVFLALIIAPAVSQWLGHTKSFKVL